jgi:hypothetical protein
MVSQETIKDRCINPPERCDIVDRYPLINLMDVGIEQTQLDDFRDEGRNKPTVRGTASSG